MFLPLRSVGHTRLIQIKRDQPVQLYGPCRGSPRHGSSSDYAVTRFTMRLPLLGRSDKLRVEWKTGNKLVHLPRHSGQCIGRPDVPKGPIDQRRNHSHLGFLHAARGNRGSADPDTARYERLLGVERHSVLVDGDAHGIQSLLGSLARNACSAQIHQHQVVVGAAGD